ncbi:MAG: hemerythrin domain-containing protein [Myxococcota bacterium]
MRRDPRLTGLSSDHHGSLVLARRILRVCDEGPVEDDFADAVRGVFERELEPHFRVEEDHLLPALEAAGEVELVRRTRSDHARMRELIASLEDDGADQGAVLREFGETLRGHVRFEERQLLPASEERLDSDALDAIAKAHPHPGRFVSGEGP